MIKRGASPRWLAPSLIVLAVLVCYLPALRAGYIWDDHEYVTGNPNLGSLAGLGRIWFRIGATPQYYPLVFTTFWMEHQLWGLHPFGYHLVNVLLHAGSALLLRALLVRLAVPGAALAALLFALHPVGVESVAWITERKNVLSTFFYLLAWFPLLRFYRLDRPDPASRRSWILAFALFACALFSKTVTCTLPAAVLIVIWWKRGRLRAADLPPLIPFFLLGAGMGLLTSWMEKHVVGAQGADWALSPIAHLLLAGRITWFYLAKLLWPAGLTFIYPRWQIDPRAGWQYLFPLGMAALLAMLWLARRRLGRGALAALLFFIVTLAPALGFVDVYPMRFSFVADHFQYLAMLGPLALAGALLAAAVRRPAALAGLGVLFAAVLGALTWRQCHDYKDYETLWRRNLVRNPRSWLAMHNLGYFLEGKGQTGEAMEFYQQALNENPRWADSHMNLAALLEARGRFDEAYAHYLEAARLKPQEPLIPYNLGVFMTRLERWPEAEAQFRKAVALKPNLAPAQFNLGVALVELGRPGEAIEHYQRALHLAGGKDQRCLDAIAEAKAKAGLR